MEIARGGRIAQPLLPAITDRDLHIVNAARGQLMARKHPEVDRRGAKSQVFPGLIFAAVSGLSAKAGMVESRRLKISPATLRKAFA